MYEPQNAIKGQVLENFLNEIPIGSNTVTTKQVLQLVDEQTDSQDAWILYTYDAPNTKGSKAGLVLISPAKMEYTYPLRLNFDNTNNEAEYEALLAVLRISKKMKVQSLSTREINAIVNEEWELNDINHQVSRRGYMTGRHKRSNYVIREFPWEHVKCTPDQSQ
ncbi:reverse transcriptase domain-containing protein [Tanacetum coccineum]